MIGVHCQQCDFLTISTSAKFVNHSFSCRVEWPRHGDAPALQNRDSLKLGVHIAVTHNTALVVSLVDVWLIKAAIAACHQINCGGIVLKPALTEDGSDREE
jgi:hypothetical protein